MGKLLKTKTSRALAITAVLLCLYTLSGFFLAPRLVRGLLLDNIQKTLGVVPQLGEIRVNPLTLRLEVQDFSLPAANGGKLLGFERFSVQVRLASIWHRALVFGDIVLDAPFVNTVVSADGTVNLLQLRAKNPPAPAAAPEKKSAGPLPRILIGLFQVNRGLVSYEDESRTPAFATRLEPIEFDLRDFSTGDEGGQFDFSGKTRNDERIEWHGHLNVATLESDGQIRLTGLQAKTIWEYIESRVNFAISAGKLNVEADYRVSVKESTALQVELRQVELTGLGIRPKGGDTDWISVPDLHIGATTLDLGRRDVKIDSIAFKGLQVSAWLNADRSLNLSSLAAAPASTAKPASAAALAAAPAPPSALAPATPAWRVALRDLSLQDAGISFEDRSVKPVAKFAIAPLSLQIEGASLDLSQPVQVKLDAGINSTGHLLVGGSVTPMPLAANVGVQLSKLDLTALQPYANQWTDMSVVSGQLGADLKVNVGAAKPGVALKGAISVAALHTVDNTLQDDFINWDNLDVLGFSYQQKPARLEIDRIFARRLYSRTIVEADSTLNIERVLRIAKNARKSVPATPGAAPVAVSSPSSAPAAAPTKAGGAAMFIAIHKVEVNDSTVNFSDFSISPNFSAGIQRLNGTLNGLSSQPGTRAKLDLKGEMDAFSPVTIAGDISPLSPALYADVEMSFRNIELSIMNPYSGKFAGYNIAKGKLTTELHYQINGRKLDAQHHVIIDQLEFGDKTESKDAVSLPIKLAVALLKDRDGVIDLNLPVNGSLDDPQFSIMPVIGRVLKETLEKLITAPFAALGALFASGPELQFVDFQPGSAALDSAAADRLKAVAKALAERPALKLELPIAVVAQVDKPALAAAKLQAQLQGQKAGSAAIPSRLSRLQALYAGSVGAAPKYPDGVKSDAQKGDFLEAELRQRIAVSDQELIDLGQQRALTLQSAL